MRRMCPAAAGGGPSKGAPDAGREEPGTGRGHRILVVEDEWFVAAENEAALLGARYEVVGVAMSDRDALQIAEATRPDLVLMDIRVPGVMDGIDIAVALRERYGIPSIFVTAHSDDAMRARGEAARPRGWLVKPFSSQQLLRAVEAALRPDDAGA